MMTLSPEHEAIIKNHMISDGIAPPDILTFTSEGKPNRFDISKQGDNAGWYYIDENRSYCRLLIINE